jgi:hypothetical protein
VGQSDIAAPRFDQIDFLNFLADRDPHDADSVADHVGRALLTAGGTRRYCAPLWLSAG